MNSPDFTATQFVKANESAQTSDQSSVFHEWQSELSGRFELGRMLGSGGMSFVYHATDVRTGNHVALKFMKTHLSSAASAMFKREFESIAAIDHPHCLQVFDYDETRLGPFFTMELFVADPLTVVADRRLDIRLDAIRQLGIALDYIHERGFIHRDIKPTNVLAAEDDNAGPESRFQVKLADFGLVKFAHQSDAAVEEGFGTPAYASPEQFNNERLDHRSDLYALGVLAYEILSGHHPFEQARDANGPYALMRAHLSETAASLSTIDSIPDTIASLVDRYLAKNAHERPESASPLCEAIAHELGLELDLESHDQADYRPDRVTVFNTGFVCRKQELDRIDDYLQHVMHPRMRRATDNASSDRMSFQVVLGEPGIGKSSLIREALRAARGCGFQVYEGRCFQGNKASFQPFVDIFAQLLAQRGPKKTVADKDGSTDLNPSTMMLQVHSQFDIESIIDRYTSELLRIAPELNRFLEGEAFQRADVSEETNYIYRTIATFFGELASQQPMLLFIDDLQWADPSTLDLLSHLVQFIRQTATSAANELNQLPRLAICCTGRSGYSTLDHYLQQRHADVDQIELARLSVEETAQLVSLRLNCTVDEVSNELAERLHETCNGNPFFSSETVRAWLITRNIQRVDHEWNFINIDSTQAGKLAKSARDTIVERLQDLDSKTQLVLDHSAVIGQVVDSDLLAESIPDLASAEIVTAVTELNRRNIILESDNGASFRFVHDVLRETTLEQQTGFQTRAIHKLIGEILEMREQRGEDVSVDELAKHFEAAGIEQKAFRYLLQAARLALDSFAIDGAIKHLLSARSYPFASEQEHAYAISTLLAKAYWLSGDLEVALTEYQNATKAGASSLEKAAAMLGTSQVSRAVGRYDDCEKLAWSTLKLLNIGRPRNNLSKMARSIPSLVYIHSWILFARIGNSQKTNQKAHLITSSFRELASVFSQRSMIRFLHANTLATAAAIRSGNPDAISLALSWYRHCYAMSGMSFVCVGIHRKILKLKDFCQLAESTAEYHGEIGSYCYFRGRLREAEESGLIAYDLLERRADSFWKVLSIHHLRHIYHLTADFPSEVRYAREERMIAERMGDAEIMSWGEYGLANAYARKGQSSRAIQHANNALALLEGRRAIIVEPIALHVKAFVLIQGSLHRDAIDSAEKASNIAMRAGTALNEYCVRMNPLLVEACLGPNWLGDSISDRKKVSKYIRRSRVAATVHPNIRPHVLRMRGRYLAARGRWRSSLGRLKTAIRLSQRSEMKYDQAQAMLDYAAVLEKFAGQDKRDEHPNQLRSEAIEMLREIQASIPAAESWLLGEFEESATDVLATELTKDDVDVNESIDSANG